MDAMPTMTDWLSDPKMRAAIERCVQRAFRALERDTPLRVPNNRADRERGFERWLARYRSRLGPLIQTEFVREFSETLDELRDPDSVRRIVDEYVWPEVEAFLRE